MDFGINLGFAIKRWPQPHEWAAVVRDELGLDLVQFSFDLLDPWWPEHRRLAARTRAAADDHGIRIHSAQVGLAKYTYNGLLHPDPDARASPTRSEEHTSELQSHVNIVCRLLL